MPIVAGDARGVFARLFGAAQIVREGQAGLLFRDGTFTRSLPPGRHWIGPRESLLTVTTMPQLAIVAGQELLSADGFAPRVTAAVTYAVADPYRATMALSGGYAQLLTLELQIALRAMAAGRTAEELPRTPRETLEAELLAAVRAPAAEAGLDVRSVRLRDVVLPADLRRLITGVEKARREGQAALERAHAEQAALRSLANAARMLKNNPELQNLRLIQALSEGKNPTIVLGGGGGLTPLRGGEPDER